MKTEEELKSACKEVFRNLKVSHDESKCFESLPNFSLIPRYYYHAGRIAASRFDQITQASMTKPPSLLINKLLELFKINLMNEPSLKWGIDKEDEARSAYQETTNRQHEDFRLINSSLLLNPNFPHLDATPYGVISCDCCGY